MCFKNLIFYLNFYKLSFIVAKTNKVCSVTLGAQLYLRRTNSRQTRHELVTDGGRNIGGMVSIVQIFIIFLIHQQSLFIWHSYLTVELSIYKGCCKYHIWKYQYYNNKLRTQFNISGFALSPQIPLYQHHVFFVVFVYSSHLISAALDATVCILLAFSLWLQQEPFILSFWSFPSSQNYLGSAQRGIQCSQGCNTVHLHLSILTSLSDGWSFIFDH